MFQASKSTPKLKLKVGDKVIVLSGKYKNKTGKILRAHPQLGKVTVEGINIVKKHIKPTKENKIGSIKEITKPIDVSKVAIVDPKTKKATRVAYKFDKDGKKIRIYSSSKEEIK